MREFAEQEIILPDGPFEGRRFRCDRQPYTGLFFDQVDGGRWPFVVVTGPTQSGKSETAYVIPLLYHLFEVGETVIAGLPDMTMARDKWREDIEPSLARTRFADYIPRMGGGSRGGTFDAIQFGNGATLKFMSGGGGDKSRAGFTARVVVITEADGLDVTAASSREATKIVQLMARTRAYGARARVYTECTVSTEDGFTWRNFKDGTKSRIVVPCPHCREYVAPEREHLQGWQHADSKVDARAEAYFICPECRGKFSGKHRVTANRRGVVVHEGQTIDSAGVIHGVCKTTETLGFRWSAFNNLFVTAGDIGADEWAASRNPDEENALKELLQFVWCLPYNPPVTDVAPLNQDAIMRRTAKRPKGYLPDGTDHFTVAVDLGKFKGHWVATAWTDGGNGHVADYGTFPIESDDYGVEIAILAALRAFRDDLVLPGWTRSDDEPFVPEQVWIDSGYQPTVVDVFCLESGERFRPYIGRGTSQMRRQRYRQPKTTGATTLHVGDHYHVVRLQRNDQWTIIVEIDADHWKTRVRQQLAIPVTATGALTLFQTLPHEHRTFARHLTAERQVEEFVPGKGKIVRWEALRQRNHFFDALYAAAAAAHGCGVRLVLPEREHLGVSQLEPPPLEGPTVVTPNDEPFFILDRMER